MRTPSILVVPRLPEEVEHPVRSAFPRAHFAAVQGWDGRCPPECPAPDAVIVAPPCRVDAALVGRLPSFVRIVGACPVGTDHIEAAVMRSRGLTVVNTPDVLTDAVAGIGMFRAPAVPGTPGGREPGA